MTYTHETWKIWDAFTVVEDFGCHTVAFALVDPASTGTGCDTTCILTTMLEKVECVVNVCCSGCGSVVAVYHSYDTTHVDVIII